MSSLTPPRAAPIRVRFGVWVTIVVAVTLGAVLAVVQVTSNQAARAAETAWVTDAHNTATEDLTERISAAVTAAEDTLRQVRVAAAASHDSDDPSHLVAGLSNHGPLRFRLIGVVDEHANFIGRSAAAAHGAVDTIESTPQHTTVSTSNGTYTLPGEDHRNSAWYNAAKSRPDKVHHSGPEDTVFSRAGYLMSLTGPGANRVWVAELDESSVKDLINTAGSGTTRGVTTVVGHGDSTNITGWRIDPQLGTTTMTGPDGQQWVITAQPLYDNNPRSPKLVTATNVTPRVNAMGFPVWPALLAALLAAVAGLTARHIMAPLRHYATTGDHGPCVRSSIAELAGVGARIASDGHHNQERERAADERAHQLESLWADTVTTQKERDKTLAEAIHDGPMQVLAAAALAHDNPAFADQMRAARDDLSAVVDRLGGATLVPLSLADELEHLCTAHEHVFVELWRGIDPRATRRCSEPAAVLDAVTAALRSAAHSGASTANVVVRGDTSTVTAVVCDNRIVDDTNASLDTALLAAQIEITRQGGRFTRDTTHGHRVTIIVAATHEHIPTEHRATEHRATEHRATEHRATGRRDTGQPVLHATGGPDSAPQTARPHPARR